MLSEKDKENGVRTAEEKSGKAADEKCVETADEKGVGTADEKGVGTADEKGVGTKSGLNVSWSVKNLSHWDIKLVGRSINSPLFKSKYFSNCSWHLKMTPRGEIKGDDHFHVYLVLFSGELDGTINCDTSFIDDDKLCISSGRLRNQVIGKRKSLKLPPCLMQEDVFLTKKSTFLPNDVFTISCRIWKDEPLYFEPISIITEIIYQQERFTWKLENFPNLQLGFSKTGKILLSFKGYASGNVDFRFTLSGDTLADSFFQFEFRASTNERLLMAFKLWVENIQSIVDIFEIKKVFKKSRRPLIFQKFLARNTLLDCLQDGVLSITGDLVFLTGDYREVIEMDT